MSRIRSDKVKWFNEYSSAGWCKELLLEKENQMSLRPSVCWLVRSACQVAASCSHLL